MAEQWNLGMTPTDLELQTAKEELLAAISERLPPEELSIVQRLSKNDLRFQIPTLRVNFAGNQFTSFVVDQLSTELHRETLIHRTIETMCFRERCVALCIDAMPMESRSILGNHAYAEVREAKITTRQMVELGNYDPAREQTPVPDDLVQQHGVRCAIVDGRLGKHIAEHTRPGEHDWLGKEDRQNRAELTRNETLRLAMEEVLGIIRSKYTDCKTLLSCRAEHVKMELDCLGEAAKRHGWKAKIRIEKIPSVVDYDKSAYRRFDQLLFTSADESDFGLASVIVQSLSPHTRGAVAEYLHDEALKKAGQNVDRTKRESLDSMRRMIVNGEKMSDD